MPKRMGWLNLSALIWNMRSVVMLAFLMMLAASPSWVSARDLHRMWDDRCFECHGHAGEFARRSLNVVDGKLQGRHHVDGLKRFLSNHHLSGDDVDAVHDMLLAQATTQGQFKENCSACHGSAAKFVRESIERRDDNIYARRSAKSVVEFLRHHRGLDASDVDFYAKLLARVAQEVHRQ